MARLAPAWLAKAQSWSDASGTSAVAAFSLALSFAAWFLMSAVVVRMPETGFPFSIPELFWLVAAPGLAAGVLQILHSWLRPAPRILPAAGAAIIIEVIAMVWLGWALQERHPPWSTLMLIGFVCGIGGGIFACLAPLHCSGLDRGWQGTAKPLYTHAAIAGVIVVQFVAPWVAGFAALGSLSGSPQLISRTHVIKDVEVSKNSAGAVTDVVPKRADLAAALVIVRDGEAVKEIMIKPSETTRYVQVELKKTASGTVVAAALQSVTRKTMWLQNAAFVWVPWLLLALAFWVGVRRKINLPASDLQKHSRAGDGGHTAGMHAWNCRIAHVCAFGSFLGFAAAFPMLIHTAYGGFERAPDPLAYAFVGPLLGGAAYAVSGGFFDRIGAGKGLCWTTLGQLGGCLFLAFGGYLTPATAQQFSGFLSGMLFVFLMSGLQSAATCRLYAVVFAHSPARGAHALASGGAWAAFAPFVWNALIGASLAATASAKAFFIGVALFCGYTGVLHRQHYLRVNAERSD